VNYIGYIQINKLNSIKIGDRSVSFDLGRQKARGSRLSRGRERRVVQRPIVRVAPVDSTAFDTTAFDTTALDNTAALGATHSTDGMPAGGTSKGAARRKH
jgi:hypothetical protein